MICMQPNPGGFLSCIKSLLAFMLYKSELSSLSSAGIELEA
jgi:hypothetical protein